MNNIYLINVHKNFEQVGFLIDTLVRAKDVKIYLHVDKKVSIEPYLKFKSEKVEFVKNRVDVKWGGFTQVEATLCGIKEIIAKEKKFGKLSFISGQDIPIQSSEKISDFLNAKKDSEFIEWEDILTQCTERVDRYRYYYIFKNNFMKKASLKIMKILKINRKFYGNMRPYTGASWWTLTRECLVYINDFCDENIDYIKFMKTTSCSDEMFFQTIILNSKFKEKVENNNLRYIDWEGCWDSPNILKLKDYDKIKTSNKLFARKIDFDIDKEIAIKLVEENS